MERSLISASKFLSLILRHQPETIGLQLDSEGWADVSALLEKASAHGRRMDFDLLLRIVHENDKQRFALSDDGTRIRANQGHSIDVDLGLNAVEPPQVLFHGTVERFLQSILRQGLIPGARQHVHLSSDRRTAEIVGKRRGEPVVLIVQSLQMHEQGRQFYLSQNGVWLTAHVPPEFLLLP